MGSEATTVLQYGALGILGIIMITGTGLFVWVIKWFLPRLLDLVTQATAHLITALDRISSRQNDLVQSVDQINVRLDEGDKKFESILTELRRRQ